MTFDVLFYMFVIPLLMAGALLWALQGLKRRPNILACLFSTAILVLYILSEGIPPFLPISAKQKIPYLIAIIAFTGLFVDILSPRLRMLFLCILLLTGLIWLVQRPLLAGSFHWKWITPILAIPALGFAIFQQNKGIVSRFAWPVTLFMMMITTSLIALLGGFIGVGHLMLSVSIFFGGLVFGVFVDAIRKLGPKFPFVPSSVLWAISGSLGFILILIGLYATNLSTAAYLLILTTVFVPLTAERVGKYSQIVQPFLFAAVAAIPAGAAIILAILNF